MKNNEHITTLAAVMEQAIDRARDQKRRVRRRLADMRGDFDCTPVRGPWKPRRPGVKWHLYEAARRKHAALTHEVRALAWALKQITRTA